MNLFDRLIIYVANKRNYYVLTQTEMDVLVDRVVDSVFTEILNKKQPNTPRYPH